MYNISVFVDIIKHVTHINLYHFHSTTFLHIHVISYAHQTPIYILWIPLMAATATPLGFQPAPAPGVLLPWTKDNEHWDLDGLHFSRRGSQFLGQRLAQYLQNEAGENGRRPTWMPKMRTKNATTKNGWVNIYFVRPCGWCVCVCFLLVSRMRRQQISMWFNADSV